MKLSRIVLGCILASLGFMAGGGAQVITEFSAGLSTGAYATAITAGPDGNPVVLAFPEGEYLKGLLILKS